MIFIKRLLSLCAGKLESDGTVHVTLCDFIQPWESLTMAQKKGMDSRYEMGCDCRVCSKTFIQLFSRAKLHDCHEDLDSAVKSPKYFILPLLIICILSLSPQIIHCASVPCAISDPAECLWTDWLMESSVQGPQARHYTCIKRNDNSCAWYRGAAAPKKEFMDIEDP